MNYLRGYITITWTLLILAVLSIHFVIVTCERIEPEPFLIVSTDTISAITFNSCLVAGSIIDLGSDASNQHGFCWSEKQNPGIEKDSVVDLGSNNGLGQFNFQVNNLLPATSYFIRAYAVNDQGTVYGGEIVFKTLEPDPPLLKTTNVTSITQTSVETGGEVLEDGGAGITARGVCWSTRSNPDILDQSLSDGSGKGTFTSSLSGLACGTVYFIRAYATNSAGTSYGDQLVFTTSSCPVAIPTLTTSNPGSEGLNSASCGGTITSDGGKSILAKGVCWSTSPNPTIAAQHSIEGTGTSAFTSEMTGLTCAIHYYVKAYATNVDGTGYGQQVELTTSDCEMPVVKTISVSGVTSVGALCQGRVLTNGGAQITSRGVCWDTNQAPDLTDWKKEDGTGIGDFVSELSSLGCNTTYFVRAYATNSAGTAFGEEYVFSTSECEPGYPTVTTSQVVSMGLNSAQCESIVTDDGGSDLLERGICWSTSEYPTISDDRTVEEGGTGGFSSAMEDLVCGTRYYVRAYAVNEAGPGYGEQIDFFTDECPLPPSVSTGEIGSISENSANCTGTIDDNGGADISERGFCWSTSPGPTIEDNKTVEGFGAGIFTGMITGLSELTTYYVRAYAINIGGISYSGDVVFKSYGTVSDISGNTYQTVEIGAQVWMRENLRVEKFNDGSNITRYTNMSSWETQSTPGYCYYNFDSGNRESLGALYHWQTVTTAKACPTGWHVPAESEWNTLFNYLGGLEIAGGKLKEEGTLFWDHPNSGANNESGFSARGVGYLGNYLGSPGFNSIGETTGLWSTNFESIVFIKYSEASVSYYKYSMDFHAYSIRCIRDE